MEKSTDLIDGFKMICSTLFLNACCLLIIFNLKGIPVYSYYFSSYLLFNFVLYCLFYFHK